MQGPVDDFSTFLPGTASLLEEVDHKILVVLQDGRKLFGTLRSFDQYGNLPPPPQQQRNEQRNLWKAGD